MCLLVLCCSLVSERVQAVGYAGRLVVELGALEAQSVNPVGYDGAWLSFGKTERQTVVKSLSSSAI